MISSVAEQQIAQPQAAAPSLFRVEKVDANPQNNAATVTIGLTTPTASSDVAFLHLRSFDAKKLAIAEASKKGIPNPGVQQTGNPYPVDAKGDRLFKLDAQSVIHSWRTDILVQARLF